jgi:Flp pilus assembly protein TadD
MLEEPRLDSRETDEVLMNLVELALQRPPGERERYLRGACADEPQLFEPAWNYVQAEQRMGGFLLDPLFSPPQTEQPLQPGDLLHQRFRIIREVAQGGMGVVYEAHDEKLDRRIAIKCAKAGFRKRLPPEVRNASEISHPNVCKIFEIHTASVGGGEFDFLTMEFLEGETLSQRMRRGPIGKQEARTIARQLCEGLAEAHRNQVIHGDLKSTNVILTAAAGGGARAVITDFGLASKPSAAQVGAPSQEPAGTPDYMAPELLKGGKASSASDLYALGVILYNLVTGRPPFPPDASWEDRLARKPPPVKHPWNRVLERCLDPDPTLRYRDADEVARALAPPVSRRRFLAVAALVLLAVVASIVAARPARQSVRLAVLPFESAGVAAPVMDALTRDVAAQLASIKGNARTKFMVIPVARAVRKKVATGQDARAKLGATHSLHVSLRQENDKLILDADLTETRLLVQAKEWRAQYSSDELRRYVPAALAGIVTATLRLPSATPATVSGAARRDYLDGLLSLRRDSGVEAALIHLEKAVAADPDSPLTHAALAEARWFKYGLYEDPLWLDRATESLKEAERRNPDVAALHRMAGLLQGNAGRYEAAMTEYHRAIELEPNNSDAYRRLGMVYERSNRLDEALAAYRRAVELEPQYYRNHQALGSLHNTLANYSEAVRHFENTVRLAPDEPVAHFALAAAYSKSGRFAEAEKELRSSIRLKETPNALHTLGVVLIYQERDREAVSFFQRVLGTWPERYLSWMTLGMAYRRGNLLALSYRANRRGLELAEKELARDPRNGTTRSYMAYMCARLGDRRRAESEIAQALQLSPNDADALWAAAMTYEALGRRERTLAVMRDSPQEVLAEVSRWPDVADLRTDPRFLQLVASQRSN